MPSAGGPEAGWSAPHVCPQHPTVLYGLGLPAGKVQVAGFQRGQQGAPAQQGLQKSGFGLGYGHQLGCLVANPPRWGGWVCHRTRASCAMLSVLSMAVTTV